MLLTKGLSFKAEEVKEDGSFAGYASTFGNVDFYGDVIRPGAFVGSLKAHADRGSRPAMLWQHRHDELIGVWEELAENDKGLVVRGRLLINDLIKAREAYALLKAEAISGLSIGYHVIKDEYDHESDIRTLTEIDLKEVSLVTFPANGLARVEGVKARPETLREFEFFLSAGGFSRKEAKRIARDGFGLKADKLADNDEVFSIIRNIVQKYQGV